MRVSDESLFWQRDCERWYGQGTEHQGTDGAGSQDSGLRGAHRMGYHPPQWHPTQTAGCEQSRGTGLEVPDRAGRGDCARVRRFSSQPYARRTMIGIVKTTILSYGRMSKANEADRSSVAR